MNVQENFKHDNLVPNIIIKNSSICLVFSLSYFKHFKLEFFFLFQNQNGLEMVRIATICL